MSRNNTKIASYCKVCQDAGKPEAIYRSHFTRETRDPNSKITCPTLLALECRYCYKAGHTVKYCKVLKDKNNQQQKQQQQANKPKSKSEPQPPAKKPKSSNPYIYLDSDSEEETQQLNANPIELFPQLVKPQYQGNSYAAALASKPEVKPAPVREVVAEPVTPVAAVTSAPKLAPWVSAPQTTSSVSLPIPPPPIRRPMTSWADDTDSDDEEDIMPATTMKKPQNFSVVMPVLDDDW